MCSAATTRRTPSHVSSPRGRAQQLCTREAQWLQPRIPVQKSWRRPSVCSLGLPRPSQKSQLKRRRSESIPIPSRLDRRLLSITVRSIVGPRSSARWALQQCCVRCTRG
jgi:hypothetical protein